jgi:hypothetical protein
MQLLCIGLLFVYCINPTTAWTAAAIPPADHESILYALEFAGLSSFKNVLWSAINKEGFLVPPSATIFVPTNAATDAFTVSNQNFTDLCSYHITNNNYYFDDLISFHVGTQIPTLLSNNTLLVTNNNSNNFRINNNKLMATNLYTIQTVACYVVSDILNSTIWGQAIVKDNP